MNLGEKILEMFIDLPLKDKEIMLFVNRGKELRKMENTGRFMHSSIYGIAGETGSGKTTLFNLLKFPDKEMEKIIIPISEKETKEAIIADLLYKLCDKVIQNKQFSDSSNYAKETIDFLDQEEVKSREKGIKIGKIIEGESKWAAQAKERYNLTSIKNRLKKVIHSLTSGSKIVLCIDEIDKERKGDVIVILDSLKDILRSKNLLTFFALPQVMYKEYIADKYRFFKEENLENILKDVIPVTKMSDNDIKEMLNRRTREFPEILPRNVRDMVIELSDGSPREALLICQNTILSKEIGKSCSKQDFILSTDEIKNEVENFLDVWVDSLKLTNREEEVVQIISHERILSRRGLTKMVLENSKIVRSTLFRIIENLVEKKILFPIRAEKYEINRKLLLYYKYFSPAKLAK